MASSRKIRLPWTGVHAIVTASDIFVPATEFMQAAGMGSARATGEMRARFGNCLASPAFQTANDWRQPDTAVAIPFAGGASGYANADAGFDVTNATTLTVSDKALIRFGWLVKLGAGTNGGAHVRGTIEVQY